MMKTMTVVTTVSRRVGHVTLAVSCLTSCKKAKGFDFHLEIVSLSHSENRGQVMILMSLSAKGIRYLHTRAWTIFDINLVTWQDT